MVKKIFLSILVVAISLPALSLTNDDLLALVAMPLAVAAAAEVPQVPLGPLGDFVALLNQAAVPPAQIVESVRYVPVAFIEEPQFVPYVRTQYDGGLRGVQLVRVIQQQYETFGLPGVNLVVTAPRFEQRYEPRIFIPEIVWTRVREGSQHPHGGPPGQLKKQLGLQTGAEVVHGTKPGGKVKAAPPHGNPHANKPAKVNGKPKGGGNDKPHGNGNGHGKGKH